LLVYRVVDDIAIRIHTERPVRNIRLLRAGMSLEHARESGGWASFTIPELHDFEVVLVQYK